jgi:hypothetical protein
LTPMNNGFGAASLSRDLAVAMRSQGGSVLERHLMQLSSQPRDSVGRSSFSAVRAAESPLDLHLVTKEWPYLLKVPKTNSDLAPENRAKTSVPTMTTADPDTARWARKLNHALSGDQALKDQSPEEGHGHPHHPDSPTPTPTPTHIAPP